MKTPNEIARKLREAGLLLLHDTTPVAALIAAELAPLEQERERLRAQRENMCAFITRLCRKCYALGWRGKLTADAMDYINSTDAENTPATKLLRKILQ